MLKYTIYRPSGEESFQARTDKELLARVEHELSSRGLAYDRTSLIRGIEQQNKKQEKPRRIRISDMIKGATAAIRYMTGKAVSNEEILRRSSICASCPRKNQVSDCMGCGGTGRLAGMVNDIRRDKGKEVEIPATVKPYFCDVCGCSLALMIVTKHSDLEPENPEVNESRPDFCWLKKTSKNFTNE